VSGPRPEPTSPAAPARGRLRLLACRSTALAAILLAGAGQATLPVPATAMSVASPPASGATSSAPGALPRQAAAKPRSSLPAIERQVMCVTCKIPLNVAESPQADRERSFIQGLIDQGQSEAQIKRALVGQYGPAVLALPSAHGFDLAAYLVPFAVLLALLTGLALLPLWRRRTPPRAPDAGASPLSSADAARLDADLAHFDGGGR
jgi:cytochrome c-type biogenesis protein CcmH